MTDERTTTHLWVASYPFLESTLIVTPGAVRVGDEPAGPLSGFDVRFQLFDADGLPFNEVAVSCKPTEVTFIELDSFMGACKMESGIRHAHAAVSAPLGARVACRLHNNEGAFFETGGLRVGSSESAFLPVTVQRERSNYLCLLNEGGEEAVVRCRLFSGKRMPETTISVPARGVRLVPIEREFKEFSEAESERSFQMYVRLGLRSGSPVIAHHLDRAETTGEQGVFSALS